MGTPIFLLTVGLLQQPFPLLLLSCSPLSAAFLQGSLYVGRRALQWELILPSVDYISSGGEQGSAVSGCIVSIASGWPDCLQFPCSFIPCWGIIHGLHLWQKQPNQWGGRRLWEKRSYSAFSQCQICYVFMSFPNSWIEKILWLHPSLLPLFWGIWGFYEYIVNQLQLITWHEDN